MFHLFLAHLGLLFHGGDSIRADAVKAPSQFVYYYSADQRKTLNDIEAIDGTPIRLFVTINGKKLEYTECEPSGHPGPLGRFKDFKTLGKARQGCRRW